MKSVKLILVSFFVGAVLAFPISTLANFEPPCVTCIDYYSTGTHLCNLMWAEPYAQECHYDCYPQESGPMPEGTYLTFCAFE